jgi:hypothetical protein
MAYTTIDNPELYFQCKLYTGSGSIQAITLDGDENMQPDFIWCKSRGETRHHYLADSVRGVKARLRSDATNAEYTANSTSGFDSFDSDGFTLEEDSSSLGLNESSHNMVSWNWKAGTSFSNDASATSVGTIDSSGSASSDAGFSIVSYTGTGSAGTIKHGLGSTPAFMMVKNRGAAQGWCIYHHKNTSAPETDFLSINSDDATVDASDRWNDTAPTSSVFSVANHADTNGSGATYIGYFFNEVKGYSKFGGFTGNGNADGPYLHCGFRPAYVMIKKTSGVNEYGVWDNKRSTFNVTDDIIYANLTNSEAANNANGLDFVSNGFKIRASGDLFNANGGSYIFMAFAESPFVNSNGVPTNGR